MTDWSHIEKSSNTDFWGMNENVTEKNFHEMLHAINTIVPCRLSFPDCAYWMTQRQCRTNPRQDLCLRFAKLTAL